MNALSNWQASHPALTDLNNLHANRAARVDAGAQDGTLSSDEQASLSMEQASLHQTRENLLAENGTGHLTGEQSAQLHQMAQALSQHIFADRHNGSDADPSAVAASATAGGGDASSVSTGGAAPDAAAPADLASPAPAAAGGGDDWACTHPALNDLNQRHDNRQARVDAGASDGSLSGDEQAALAAQQQSLHQDRQAFLNQNGTGHLTGDQSKQLHAEARSLSGQIYADRHN